MTAIGTRHPRWVTTLALTSLALSALWLGVTVVTDFPYWPLAVWIAVWIGVTASNRRPLDRPNCRTARVLTSRTPRSSTEADT